MKRISLISLLLLSGVICVPSLFAQNQSIESIAQAVVLVMPMRGGQNGRQPRDIGSSGSGVIIDNEEGLIITNYHVIEDESVNRPAEIIKISVIDDIGDTPTAAFYARVVSYRRDWDLALLKVYENVPSSRRAVSSLPEISLNNSISVNAVSLTDDIIVLGFPGYGQETLTVTEGNVSGFINDNSVSDISRSWIKTDAKISAGNSGGLAIDSLGRFLGIPTYVIQDYDTLGYLRPTDLAVVLLRDYEEGGGDEMISEHQQHQDRSGGKGRRRDRQQPDSGYIGQVVFATRMNNRSQPLNGGTSFAVEDAQQGVYAAIELTGEIEARQYEFVWALRDRVIHRERGNWSDFDGKDSLVVKLESRKGRAIISGNYDLLLYIDGREVLKESFSITD